MDNRMLYYIIRKWCGKNIDKVKLSQQKEAGNELL